MAFDEEAWMARGYPDRVDINALIWFLYPHLGNHVPIEEVERRIREGSLFEWLHDTFGLPRLRHEDRFLDYLRRAWDVTDYGIGDSGLIRLQAHVVEALQQSAVDQ